MAKVRIYLLTGLNISVILNMVNSAEREHIHIRLEVGILASLERIHLTAKGLLLTRAALFITATGRMVNAMAKEWPHLLTAGNMRETGGAVILTAGEFLPWPMVRKKKDSGPKGNLLKKR